MMILKGRKVPCAWLPVIFKLCWMDLAERISILRYGAAVVRSTARHACGVGAIPRSGGEPHDQQSGTVIPGKSGYDGRAALGRGGKGTRGGGHGRCRLGQDPHAGRALFEFTGGRFTARDAGC